MLNKGKDMENKTIIPPPDEIESNLHQLFETIDKALKQSRVSKRVQLNVLTYCLSILSNGIHIGEMGVTYEERMEWINKYRGYGV